MQIQTPHKNSTAVKRMAKNGQPSGQRSKFVLIAYQKSKLTALVESLQISFRFEFCCIICLAVSFDQLAQYMLHRCIVHTSWHWKEYRKHWNKTNECSLTCIQPKSTYTFTQIHIETHHYVIKCIEHVCVLCMYSIHRCELSLKRGAGITSGCQTSAT